LIEKIVDLAENLNPIALVGAGGIGKTSIALAALNHDRIKQRFGDYRRFLRCDQSTASCANLLRRLSTVIGADVENPESLIPLRKFLSSKEMMIVLDNAESILDPRGTDAQEIYAIVEELSQFDNICVCITSRIFTTPPNYKHLDVPTLSVGAAREAFYQIYDSDANRSDVIDGILQQLDFHPLSITLLATVAHQNRWDTDRLAQEWGQRGMSVLQTQHNRSLAATLELSFASPLFQEHGPDARALLEAVAFFPQGVDEKNIERLFPTISDRANIFDKLCVLSLTYRSNGFITMLAPLRDYLSPKDPTTSPLLCTTKECYFTRMSVVVDPDEPNFGETQWITSEDANVEHLLDVFMAVDTNSQDVWDACANFMMHLYWHKRRLTILEPRIDELPDDHRSKPECLFHLSRLLGSVGNDMKCQRLLIHALKLWRGRGSDSHVTTALVALSDANRQIGLHKEGIRQVEEALGIYERLGDTVGHTRCLIKLAWSLYSDKQFDAAEEAALRAIDHLPGKGDKFRVCECHRVLGNAYQSKGDTDQAIHHFELALEIASPFNWHDVLFSVHYELARLFRNQGRFDDAHPHIEHAKLHTADSAQNLGRAMELQAGLLYKQRRLEEALSEAHSAAQVYEKLGAAKKLEDCRKFLRRIEKKLDAPAASGQSDPSLNCELLNILLFHARIDSPF
jgi:tetratricopeptide (TPR) repeat protein